MMSLLGCGQHSYFLSIKCRVATVNNSWPLGVFVTPVSLGTEMRQKSKIGEDMGVDSL
jgi:hypothetical protein